MMSISQSYDNIIFPKDNISHKSLLLLLLIKFFNVKNISSWIIIDPKALCKLSN